MGGWKHKYDGESKMGTLPSEKQSNWPGGISIGIHSVLGRYATTKPRVDKWGRWVEVDIVGKNNTMTTIIGTYGPTG